MSDGESQIKFIPKKRKNFRKRENSNEEQDQSEEDSVVHEKLEDLKALQKLRNRPNGISVVTLALGEKITRDEEILCSDPFKLKNGGLVNISALKSGKQNVDGDAYDTGIGTQFSAETNKRDEDEEMMKYIEIELSKRKGRKDNCENDTKNKYCSPEEAALMAVPTHLTASSSQKSEEMLSNQMLSGIPEVDLGIEAKIRNIEATEEAKLKLLWERRNKKDGPSQFVPTNMAVNFVQHNRFNLEESWPENKKGKHNNVLSKSSPKSENSNKGTKRDRSNVAEKATDDYHFEKFKKHHRRY